jgi:hypothetical protein
MSTDYTAPHILNSLVPLKAEPGSGQMDVIGRAFAAAAKVLNGDAWGYQRKVDCAADIVARVMELRPADNCRKCGAPRAYRVTIRPNVPGIYTGRAVARKVPMCLAHGRAYPERRPVMPDERDTIARRHVSMFRLEGMAKNWRDSHLAAQARDLQVAADATTITMESYPSTSRPTGTPYRAADAAADILDTLGVDPTADALFNVAYAAARESDGLSTDEIAAELDVKPGTLRQHLNRFAGKVPSAAVYSPRVHAEALHVDLYWELPRAKDATALPSNFDAQNKRADESSGKIERTGKGGRRVTGSARWMSARTNGGTRLNPGDRTPNVREDRPEALVPDAPVRVPGPVMQDGGYLSAREHWTGDTCAQWAERLTPNTAARLASKARDQRTRAARLTDLDRNERRAAVGLPEMSV